VRRFLSNYFDLLLDFRNFNDVSKSAVKLDCVCT